MDELLFTKSVASVELAMISGFWFGNRIGSPSAVGKQLAGGWLLEWPVVELFVPEKIGLTVDEWTPLIRGVRSDAFPSDVEVLFNGPFTGRCRFAEEDELVGGRTAEPTAELTAELIVELTLVLVRQLIGEAFGDPFNEPFGSLVGCVTDLRAFSMPSWPVGSFASLFSSVSIADSIERRKREAIN